MVGEWSTAVLADLCESVDYGYTASAVNEPTAGPKFLRITDIRQDSMRWDDVPHVEIPPEKLERFRLRAGDVVVARTGAFTGANAYIVPPVPAVFASYLVRLTAGPSLDSRFAYYFMQSDAYRDHVTGVLGGSAQPNASAKALTRVEMPLPPLDEQRRIAAVLGALDDKIELNRRMNETLEKMASVLFSSLTPTEVIDLGQIATLTKGRSYSSSELSDQSDSALVTLKSFKRGGGYREVGLKGYTGAFKPEQAIQPGEVVLACTDVTQAAEVIGRPAVVAPSLKYVNLVASLDTVILRTRSERVSRAFLYYLTRAPSFTSFAVARTTGTTVLHLKPDALLTYPVGLPAETDLHQFDALAGRAIERQLAAAKENSTLAAFRAGLLPKLVSGALRILDAELLVSAVT